MPTKNLGSVSPWKCPDVDSTEKEVGFQCNILTFTLYVLPISSFSVVFMI